MYFSYIYFGLFPQFLAQGSQTVGILELLIAIKESFFVMLVKVGFASCLRQGV